MGSDRAEIEPRTDVMNRRRGADDFRSRGRRDSVTLTEPSKLTEMLSDKLSINDGVCGETPALLMRMSSFPNFSVIWRVAASTEEGFVTSS